MASIVIDHDNNNLKKLAELAGGNPDNSVHSGGSFYVEGVTQEDLDAALVEYNNNFEEHCLIPIREETKNIVASRSAAFINTRYAPYRRELFVALAEEARNSGLTDRVTYINQMLIWVKTIVAAVLAAEDMIDAYTTVEEIRSTNLNTEVFVSTDPEITVRGAMAINRTSNRFV
jgi:hypothetical protein